jgi:gamma-glutamyltranspeptidase/glutathione hydrolase
MRRVKDVIVARSALGVPLVLALALGGCETLTSVKKTFIGGDTNAGLGQPGFVEGFIGGTVADEPRAALVGREVLSSGGTAADAAVAIGFALSATLPSRAGLGGGGVCIAYAANKNSPNGGTPEAVSFVPLAPRVSSGGERPSALPLMARGLFQLHIRYGMLPFDGLVSRAEQLARSGVPASRAFVKDLALVAGPLLADPTARRVFSRAGTPLTEGQPMVQAELAGTLAQIRTAGVGDLYQGNLARQVVEASRQTGGPLTIDDLRGALPGIAPAIVVAYKNDKVAFPPPPSDGGLSAAAAFSSLVRDPSDLGGAAARSLSAAGRFRAVGGDGQALAQATDLPPASLPPLPASTTFGALDRNGNAVMCAVTMGNLFGTGRLLPGLGFLMAASPASLPPPLLSVGLAWSPRDNAFHAAAGGSGQAGAPVAVAAQLMSVLSTGKPTQVSEPGRSNVIACTGYLPGSERSCGFATDPREAGLAAAGQ